MDGHRTPACGPSAAQAAGEGGEVDGGAVEGDLFAGFDAGEVEDLVDVVEELGESLSVETELGVRLILRGADFDSSTEPQVCAPTATAEPVLRPVVGELPEALRNLRMR